MDIEHSAPGSLAYAKPWNKGKLTGVKPPLQPKHVWAIRIRLQISARTRDSNGRI
jgi:hypothetical protein